MSSLRSDAGLGHLTKCCQSSWEPQEKKRPWSPYPRVRPLVLFPTTLQVFSCEGSRTGGSGSADRSGFGCPQSIKRRQVPLQKRAGRIPFRTYSERRGWDSNPRGVTPTRFRDVRYQPDSATSPNALRRPQSLKADEPSTHSMLQKPTELQCGRLEAQPCSGN